MPKDSDTSRQVSQLAQPWHLPEFLEAQEQGVPTCKARYKHEIQAFTELGQIFDKLAEASRSPSKSLTEQERLQLVFLFAVKNQMYGIVTSLLRLRTVDAMNGTRYAIEATGIAHLLWRTPKLFQTYINAYSNINSESAANRWKPSKKYKEAFRTGELFDSLRRTNVDAGTRLSEAYAIICYRASHAGPGILHNLKKRDGKIYYHAHELDQTALDRSWASLLVNYFDMVRVFFEMLKERMNSQIISAFRQDLDQWLETFGKPLAREAMRRESEKEGRTDATI